MKVKRTFYEWVTKNYTFTIRDEENLAHRWTIRLNKAKMALIAVSLFVILAVGDFYFFRWVDTYTSDEYRKEMIYNHKLLQLQLKLDSLKWSIARKDSFIASFKKIVE